MKELCGIEFSSEANYQRFVKRNPQFADTTTLYAGHYTIVVFKSQDFPTRDVLELFDTTGRQVAKFIGPDALKLTYQIEAA
jgi:hypothetical protein